MDANAVYVDEGIALLEGIFADRASVRIRYDRDKADDFAITVEMLSDTEQQVSPDEVLAMIPCGSDWAPALGWRSFFGHPFTTISRKWMAIGVEGVVPHETRGASPVLRAYLFPEDRKPLTEMEKLADAIVGGRVSCQRKIYGVIAATSQTAIEHRPVEAFIIGAAAEKYRSKSDLLFRTLIICKERIPPLGFSPPPILIATVPSIKSRFGKPKQWLLKLHMNMSRKPNAASAVQGEDGISQE